MLIYLYWSSEGGSEQDFRAQPIPGIIAIDSPGAASMVKRSNPV
jgi:hypothetical protein